MNVPQPSNVPLLTTFNPAESTVPIVSTTPKFKFPEVRTVAFCDCFKTPHKLG
jgi:hypothetical protein